MGCICTGVLVLDKYKLRLHRNPIGEETKLVNIVGNLHFKHQNLVSPEGSTRYFKGNVSITGGE